MSATIRHEEATQVQIDARLDGIRSGMLVRCRDGVVGRVVGLAPAWLDRPTHLVVQTTPLGGHEIVLSLRHVKEVMPDHVLLDMRRRHFARSVPPITDATLHAEICRALYNTPTFRVHDAFLAIDVGVQDHVVTLRGYVRTVWRSLLAETITRQVPGVWDVQNELIADDELADAVTQVVRREPRLRGSTMRVHVLLGEVALRGRVRSAEDAVLAVLLVRGVRGVRQISNEFAVEVPAPSAPALVDGHTVFAARRLPQVGAS